METDHELDAMEQCYRVLQGLGPEVRRRVFQWLDSKLEDEEKAAPEERSEA